MKTQFLVLMSFSLIAFSSMTSAQGSSPSLPTNASPQIIDGAKLYQSNLQIKMQPEKP
jgi:hypothetical protein